MKLTQARNRDLPAPAASATLALEHFLPYRLAVLSFRVSRGIARVYADRFGLTIPEWRVLAVLGRYPGISANEVAERSAMDKVMVSRAVARLLEAGLLKRRTDAADRRRSALALSPRGAAVYAEVVPQARALEADVLAVLTPAEAAEFDRLLDKLLARTAGTNAP